MSSNQPNTQNLPHASVVIPTKNAMPRFIRVLSKVLSQKTEWEFEVIVIDSGSSDGTVQYAEAQKNVRVIQIKPEEFGHGKTRNHAAAESNGEFIAFLTHDAEPANDSWLANLVSSVEQDENIAGAFGHHIAYPTADPYTKRDLKEHFEGFLHHPLVVNKDIDPKKYLNDLGWQQFLHFYSDNNSCLRRSVWEKIPYPDVEFAEDQIWAKEIIHLGYSKAYAPEATVYHSHDYGLFERLQRSFDESKAFNVLFGYRLCIGVSSLAYHLQGLSRKDFLYGIRNKAIRGNSLLILRRFMDNLMHITGHYLGTNHKKLPTRVSVLLSRDKIQFLG